MVSAVTDAYLRQYHDSRPAVTEQLLERCAWHGRSPYDDVADIVLARVDRGAAVLDLACGSGPMAPRLDELAWLGLDRSSGELTWAHRRGSVIEAEAHRIPLPDQSVDAVVATCALMLVRPLAAVLREVARVLRPGGLLVATAPWAGQLTVSDAVPLLRLIAPLGTRMRNPNDAILARWRAGDVIPGGLVVESVATRRWSMPLRTQGDVDVLLRALYLPGVSDRRIDRARRSLVAWTGSRRRFPVPIRTWVATLPP